MEKGKPLSFFEIVWGYLLLIGSIIGTILGIEAAKKFLNEDM